MLLGKGLHERSSLLKCALILRDMIQKARQGFLCKDVAGNWAFNCVIERVVVRFDILENICMDLGREVTKETTDKAAVILQQLVGPLALTLLLPEAL